MAMTKRQRSVIEALQNGGWIWMAGKTAFLTTKEGERLESKAIHAKTFAGLVENGAIVPKPPNRYVLPYQQEDED